MNHLRSVRVSALLAAFVLLAATLAPTVCRTTCLESGRSAVEVGHVEDCCDNEQTSDQPQFRMACCVHSEAAADLNDHVVAQGSKLVVDQPLVAEFVEPANLFVGAVAAIATTDRAPPLRAPERLSRLSIFRL